ncbi:MAG: hypothetical protein AB1705_24835 [Verrucomicrobiota bacterium]
MDAILPLHQLEILRDDESFWNARDAANTELKPKGLYLTHLFTEEDVFLRPNWFEFRVKVPVVLKHLSLFRPGTLDLILTKMMRDDSIDLGDIQFLLSQEPITEQELRQAFAQARIPDVQEFRDIFRAVQPKVLALAAKHS